MGIYELYSCTLGKILQVDPFPDRYKGKASMHLTTGVGSNRPILILAEEGGPSGLQAVSHDP